jgi:multiple sugar transport system substrate-binding protein
MGHKKFRVAVRKFGPFESAIRRQWEAFETVEGTGRDLEIVALDLHPLFHSTIGAASGADWDVVFVNTDWVAAAARGNALLDLSERTRTDPPEGYPDGWAPSLLRLQQVGDRVLGLPYHDGPECLIYRTDLFEQAGERVPETWDEFQRLARAFHQPVSRCFGAIFAAYPDGHNTVYDFCIQLWTRGGELNDPEGRFRLDSPHAVEALAFLRAMLNDASAVHPDCREMDSVKSGQAFAAGEAAMMVNWFGFAAMSETMPDSRIKGMVGVARIPHSPGVPGCSLNIYWILAIPSGAVHPELSWRFLRHCAGAAMDRLLTLEGGIGCRKSTWTDPEVNRAIPFYRRMEQLHDNARELPRLEEWPQVARIIDVMVLASINTAEPLQAITRRAQAEVDRMISA